MLHFTTETLTDLTFNFLFYFIIGSFGAFLKDLHETLTKKNEQIRLGEVLIGGACATFICLAVRDLSWFENKSIGFMSMLTFILGVVGFEIFGNLTTLDKLKTFIAKIDRFRKMSPEEWDTHSDNTEGERDDRKSSSNNPEKENESVEEEVAQEEEASTKKSQNKRKKKENTD